MENFSNNSNIYIADMLSYGKEKINIDEILETNIICINIFVYFCDNIHYSYMRNLIYRVLLAAVVVLVLSCKNKHSLNLEHIKAIGDSNPRLAMQMLDSLVNQNSIEDEYTLKSIELLEIRLSDKADIFPVSDLKIKKILPYFEMYGSIRERQEVSYYAGSVYRDLNDTPKSLEFFLQSLDYALENPKLCDSVMLRNTYSNLNYLYFNVQDFSNAALMARKELGLSLLLHTNPLRAYMHVACAEKSLGNIETALYAMDNAFDNIIKSEDIRMNTNDLTHLLYYYSQLHRIEKADSCYTYLYNERDNVFDPFYRFSIATYFESKGELEKSIEQCELMIRENCDIFHLYEGAKQLYILYDSVKNREKSLQFAKLYMSLSDSIDFGGRQELAATVNNMYNYNRDLRREMRLEAKSKRYRAAIVILSILALFLLTTAYLIFVIRRNKQLQKIMQLTVELKNVSGKEDELNKQIIEKENELLESQTLLLNSNIEIENTKGKLAQVMVQLDEYAKELTLREQQLSERIEQNKSFIQLLHHAELETEAEDVVSSIRQTTRGMKQMTTGEWRQLYQAVDKLYPNFKSELLNRLGKFSEQQMQVCYLIRIGLSNPQIQNITNQPRATVWRWVKKYEWILSL